MTLTEVLDNLRVDDLKAAAKRLGLPKTLTRKIDLSQAWSNTWKRIWDALPGPVERQGAVAAMTAHHPQNPLIVQGDHTVLVEVDSPRYEARAGTAWPASPS